MPQTYSGKFVWVELYTRDIASSKSFWCELVGWTSEAMLEGENGGYTMLGNPGNMCCGLMSMDMLPEGVPPHWLGYLSVTDVDASTRTVLASGGKVFKEPFDVPTVGRISIVADKDGAAFGLFKSETGDARDDKSVHGTWHWHELWAKDLAGAVDFYTQTFGYEVDSMQMPQGEYCVLTTDGLARGGIMQSPMTQIPAMWIPYLHVDDVDKTLARAQAMGAKIVVASREVPNVGRFAIIADNVGATVGLITPAEV
jgi:hypothetical protein